MRLFGCLFLAGSGALLVAVLVGELTYLEEARLMGETPSPDGTRVAAVWCTELCDNPQMRTITVAKRGELAPVHTSQLQGPVAGERIARIHVGQRRPVVLWHGDDHVVVRGLCRSAEGIHRFDESEVALTVEWLPAEACPPHQDFAPPAYTQLAHEQPSPDGHLVARLWTPTRGPDAVALTVERADAAPDAWVINYGFTLVRPWRQPPELYWQGVGERKRLTVTAPCRGFAPERWYRADVGIGAPIAQYGDGSGTALGGPYDARVHVVSGPPSAPPCPELPA